MINYQRPTHISQRCNQNKITKKHRNLCRNRYRNNKGIAFYTSLKHKYKYKPTAVNMITLFQHKPEVKEILEDQSKRTRIGECTFYS